MKASVIVTTYNRSKILTERSLPSALNQDFGDFEVIVLDDCSTDDTRARVTEIQKGHPRLRYVRPPKNAGLAAARNRGAREARGEYVVFLDDDDALDSSFLKTTVPILDGLPEEYGGVCGARIVIYNDDQKEYALPSLETSFYATIDDGWLLRRRIFNVIAYDESLRSDEDADFGIQFFQRYKGHIINRPLLYKYSHPVTVSKGSGLSMSNTVSISYPSEQRLTALRRYLAKNLTLFETRGDKNELAFVYRVMAGRNFCWAGKMREGIPYLWKAVRTKPQDPRNALHFIFAILGLLDVRLYVWYFAHEVAFERYVRSRFTRRVPVE